MKTTVVKGVLTSYELVLTILFRWCARSCVAILCCSYAVTCPVTGWIIKMCFETEVVCATGVARKETLVVFSIMFESNSTLYLEERGKQGGIVV